MQQLSLDAIRMFVTVHDMGGYAKAGEVIGRSQPAISLQIKKLESQLGKKLFTKVGQRHVLSLDGEWLLPHARALLALNDEVLQTAQTESLKGRLRLGIPSEFASTLLPSLIGEFSQRYPDVSLDVTSALSRNLLSTARKDDFDLVLALVPPEQKTDGEVIRKDELVWVGDNSFPIRSDLIALVLAPDGCVYRSRAIERLKQHSKNKIVIPSKTIVEFKEALIFAFLGVLKLRGEINCLQSVTGANKDHSSGKIYLP